MYIYTTIVYLVMLSFAIMLAWEKEYAHASYDLIFAVLLYLHIVKIDIMEKIDELKKDNKDV